MYPSRIRSLVLGLACAAAFFAGPREAAALIIDDFQSGPYAVSIASPQSYQFTTPTSASHCMVLSRAVLLGAGKVDAVFAFDCAFGGEVDEDAAMSGTTDSNCYTIFTYTLDLPQDFTNGLGHDRIEVVVPAFASFGYLNLRARSPGVPFLITHQIELTGPGTYLAPFDEFAGVDFTAITEFSFEFRSYADGEYRIADVRTGRAYADGLEFKVIWEELLFPPTPSPPVRFTYVDPLGDPAAEVLALDVRAAAAAGLPDGAVRLQASASGGDPAGPGRVGGLTARWESAQEFTGATLDLALDWSQEGSASLVEPAGDAVLRTDATGAQVLVPLRILDAAGAVVATTHQTLALTPGAGQPLRLTGVETIVGGGATLAGEDLLLRFALEPTAAIEPDQPLFTLELTADLRPEDAASAAPSAGAASGMRAAPAVTGGGTTLRFAAPLPRDGRVDVYDLQGRRVRSLAVDAGDVAAPWDGRDARGAAVGAGAYLLRFRDGARTLVSRVRVVR
ncbi:MAG TPA: hypothetical protein PLH84_12725 [Candidatus Krumholzibacteria bacterium]|nr:hypothetical protein [Candidatus Krumholzibacteria bacterium]